MLLSVLTEFKNNNERIQNLNRFYINWFWNKLPRLLSLCCLSVFTEGKKILHAYYLLNVVWANWILKQ